MSPFIAVLDRLIVLACRCPFVEGGMDFACELLIGIAQAKNTVLLVLFLFGSVVSVLAALGSRNLIAGGLVAVVFALMILSVLIAC